MKRSFWLVTLLICPLVLSARVEAAPGAYPNRVVDGYAIDLQPLITWWRAPKGIRPLGSWKHVTGSIARDTVFGWILTGKAEGLSRTSFLVKNPPRERLRRFQQLKRQLTEYLRARDAALEFLRRPVYTDWYVYVQQDQGPVSPISLAEYRDAGAALRGLEQNINAIRSELAPMQDAQGNFRLDDFALKLNAEYEGLPVFDHGFRETIR